MPRCAPWGRYGRRRRLALVSINHTQAGRSASREKGRTMQTTDEGFQTGRTRLGRKAFDFALRATPDKRPGQAGWAGSCAILWCWVFTLQRVCNVSRSPKAEHPTQKLTSLHDGSFSARVIWFSVAPSLNQRCPHPTHSKKMTWVQTQPIASVPQRFARGSSPAGFPPGGARLVRCLEPWRGSTTCRPQRNPRIRQLHSGTCQQD